MRSIAVRRSSTLVAVPAIAALVVLLAGCSPDVFSGESPSPSPSATTSPDSPAPELVPDGSAADNLPFFDSTNADSTAGMSDPDGRAIIDALVEAGFDKAAMQVTNDRTTIGNPADSIQFSVHLGDECLIGQFGEAVGGYHSEVAPALSGGECLVGATRTIDW